MKNPLADADQLNALSCTDIAKYLAAHGWRQEPYGKAPASLWIASDAEGREAEVVLPLRPAFRDYALRVHTLLETVARWEGRAPGDVLRDVHLIDADIVRVRRHTTDQASETIPLADGAALIARALDLMAAAASSAILRRRVAPSRRPATVMDYLSKLALGHTERGSFILTVVSKLVPVMTPEALPLLQLMDEPFPRKVTRSLGTALAVTHDAVRVAERTGDFSAFEDGIDEGVNANLCEALAGMLESAGERQDLDILLAWSPTLPEELDTPSHVTLLQTERPVLLEAAQKLRANEPLEGITITGTVTNLHRDPEAADGRATISCVVEGQLRQLLVPLPQAGYEVAIEAHRDKRGVIFRATVVQGPRQYQAENVEGFRLVD